MNLQEIDDALHAMFENGDIRVVYPENLISLIKERLTVMQVERRSYFSSPQGGMRVSEELTDEEILEIEATSVMNHFKGQLGVKTQTALIELLEESFFFESSADPTNLAPLIQYHCLRPVVTRHYRLFPKYNGERISPPEGASDYEWLHHISSAIVKDIAPWTYNYHDVLWLYFHWIRQQEPDESKEWQAYVLAEEATQFIWEYMLHAIHFAASALVAYGGLIGLQRCKEKYQEFADEDAEFTMKENEDFVKSLTMLWIRSLPLRFRRGKRRKANLDNLHMRYNEIFDVWKEAFDICRSALGSRSPQRKQGWREYIQDLFDFLPADLIERLQPLADWPDEVTARCSDMGGADNPEDIALEHAARLCDADNYAYKLSTLREYLNRQTRKN